MLQIPAHLVTTPVVQPAEATPPSEANTYTVQRGDTLWDIADEQLGDPTAWPEIWEDNAGDDMGGGRTFDDPDLILPGWELDLPGADPAEAANSLGRRSAGRRATRSRRTHPKSLRLPDVIAIETEPSPVAATPATDQRAPSHRPPLHPAPPRRARPPPSRPGSVATTERESTRHPLSRPGRRRRCGWSMRHCSPPACWRWSGSGAANGCGRPCHAIGCLSLDRKSSRPSVDCGPSTPASGHCVSMSPAAPPHGRSSAPGRRSGGSR